MIDLTDTVARFQIVTALFLIVILLMYIASKKEIKVIKKN